MIVLISLDLVLTALFAWARVLLELAGLLRAGGAGPCRTFQGAVEGV